MERVLFITNLPAPYKVEYFELLSRRVDLTVLYERRTATNRNEKWKTDKTGSYQEVYLKGKAVGTEASFSIEVVEYLERWKKDIILLNGYSSPTDIVAIMYMRLKRIRFGIICDGMLPIVDSSIKKRLKRYLISSASYWMSSGVVTTEQLIKYGADDDRIYCYPFSSVSLRDIGTVRYDKHLYKELINCNYTKMILYVGQIIHRKGIDILIEAYKTIKDKENITLIVLGGGTSTKEYQQQYSNVDGLTFVDFKGKEELSNYYRAADVCVLPTREDIWGLVVNEALSYGVPMVTTDKCGAGLEMIKNGRNGIIVPSENIKALSSAIEEALQMDVFENCIQTAKNYSLERMAESTINVISSECK